MLKQFKEDDGALRNAVGYIHAYQHTEDLEFVKVGDAPNQGYFKLKGVVGERHMKNLIVNMASKFMAHRMVPGTSWGSGIGYLEVGTGVGTGTTQAPQVEDVNQTALRVALSRKAITSWTFLDSAGNATASETNVVQYTTTFLETEAIGAIVEMGLFGGDATTTLGSGHMFNYKVFPVWNKQSGMRLTVIWNITY
jgi:hypothetical protein